MRQVMLVVTALLAIAAAGRAEPPFTEVASDSGLDFVQFNGMSGDLYYSEIVGGGVALIDCDGDGDLDVFLPQGRMIGPGKTLADALFPPAPGTPLGDRLFRNDLEGGRLHFTDVTAESGIVENGYGMGAAAGDFDNDGRVDLYVTNDGEDVLWRNRGGCVFEDVTAAAGLHNPVWSVSASFFDYDRDGFLDLYVGNYVDFNPRTAKPCYSTSSAREYCGPRSYNPLPDKLWHNRGDGTFEDVSAVSGISLEFGGALGVIAADFDDDGWTDLYVGNDQTPNQLWINQKDGRFENLAVLAGAAVNVDGSPEASMGVDAGDFDGDGDEDLFLTHLMRQTNTLYVNEGDGGFTDRTLTSGLSAPSIAFTSFGTAWIDFDNDSWLDLVVANGSVTIIPELAAKEDPFPIHQVNQLFHNLGATGGSVRFAEITDQAGPAFALSDASRGAAFGDLDNDGDTDVVIGNNNGPVRLLRNDVGNREAWIGMRLWDPQHRRDAVGARLAVVLPDGRRIWRRIRVDGSYGSANDPRILVGLGEARSVSEVQVVWPDGTLETWKDVPVGAYTTLRQGESQAKVAPRHGESQATEVH